MTPDAPRCPVVVPVPLSELLGWPVDGYSLERCGGEPAGYFEGRCPCGHERSGWLCAGHAGDPEGGGCRACLELRQGAHECPLPLARQGVPGGQ